MNIKATREDLYKFKDIAPFFNTITEEDIGIFVYDSSSLLTYIPSSKVDLGLQAGSIIAKGSMPDRCIKTGKRIVAMISKEKSRCNVPYLSCATPVISKNDGEIIGCIITNQSLDTYDKVREIAQNLDYSSQEFSSAMEEMSAQTQDLSENVSLINKVSTKVAEDLRKTDEIIKFTKGIADQTNLLGLNAAIEAARVGDLGRGFGVVADEIRKLAAESSSSGQKITDILTNIQQQISQLSQKFNEIEKSMQEQAGVVQEVTASSTDLATMANDLFTFAENMYDITARIK